MIMFRIAITLLVSLALVACSGARLPAITDAPTNSILPGKIVWHDLISDTPEQSKRFYRELFGWQFEEVGITGSINYTLIRHNGRLIGGMVDQTRLRAQGDISQWISLVSVADVDAASESLLAAGGIVIAAPTDVADRGRLAVVADPQGALFGLLQTNSRDPLDREGVEPGGFLWDELWTGDVDAAARFYKKLLNYDADDSVPRDVAELRQYRVLRVNGTPRAGIMENPLEGLEPIWVNYLRIDDADTLDAIAARVEALGGKLLVEPRDRDIGGRVALIAGPSGAGIALQTWDGSTE